MLSQFSQKESRRLFIIGAAVFMLLTAWLIFSPVGALKLYRIKNNLSEVINHNQDLSDNNQALQEEIDKLTSNPEYLEEIARKQGLLRKNEIVFKFPQKKKRHH